MKNWPGFEMKRDFRGKNLTIKVSNPAKKNKGVRSLKINGKSFDGNLVPISSLTEGAVIEARLEG